MAGKKGGQKRGFAAENDGKSPAKIAIKPRGPTSDSKAKKTRSIEEVMGIEALEFGNFEVGEVLTPRESII